MPATGMSMTPGSPRRMDAPERYEQLIAFLDSNLSNPVDRQESADGTVQFVGGEPADVVVRSRRPASSFRNSPACGRARSLLPPNPGGSACSNGGASPKPRCSTRSRRSSRARVRRASRDFACAATRRAAPRPNGCTMTLCVRPAQTSTAARFIDHRGLNAGVTFWRQGRPSGRGYAAARSRCSSSARASVRLMLSAPSL